MVFQSWQSSQKEVIVVIPSLANNLEIGRWLNAQINKG